MKYAFSPEEFPGLYFCDHPGKGFRLTTDLKKADIITDREEIKWRIQRFLLQSGLKPEVIKVR